MKEDYKQILQEIEKEKEKTNLLQELAKNVESISIFHKEESVTIEEFKKMGYSSRLELFENDKSLYDKLLDKEKRGF